MVFFCIGLGEAIEKRSGCRLRRYVSQPTTRFLKYFLFYLTGSPWHKSLLVKRFFSSLKSPTFHRFFLGLKSSGFSLLNTKVCLNRNWLYRVVVLVFTINWILSIATSYEWFFEILCLFAIVCNATRCVDFTFEALFGKLAWHNIQSVNTSIWYLFPICSAFYVSKVFRFCLAKNTLF